MTLSAFALIIAFVCYLLGVPLLIAEDRAVAWHKKFYKGNDILVSLVGGAFFIIAALALRVQWRLTLDGEGFVVLIAWLTLLKGLAIAWMPAKSSKIAVSFLSKRSMDLLAGFLLIVWGALFLYLGYAIPVR